MKFGFYKTFEELREVFGLVALILSSGYDVSCPLEEKYLISKLTQKMSKGTITSIPLQPRKYYKLFLNIFRLCN